MRSASGLVGDADPRGTDERHLSEVRGLESERLDQAGFLAEPADGRSVCPVALRMFVSCDAHPLARDLLVVHDRVDLLDRGRAGVPDRLRVVASEGADHLGEIEIRHARHVCGRVGGVDPATSVAVDHRHRFPGSLDQVTRGQPDNARPDHRHVDRKIPVEG
jgi:hypothetical protein